MTLCRRVNTYIILYKSSAEVENLAEYMLHFVLHRQSVLHMSFEVSKSFNSVAQPLGLSAS